MADAGRRDHWDEVYRTKAENEVSWFEDEPTMSLDLMRQAGLTPASSVLDIGGGTSHLVDNLLRLGLSRVTVLDISEAALTAAQARLGPEASRATWIAADVTTWEPAESYDIWHDRAAFHFLAQPADRAAYRRCLAKALKPGAHAVIASFAEDGPERCSGLPVTRYSPQDLATALASVVELVESRRHSHATPWGSVQKFQFSLFRRV
ncbi:MAG: class I SAM-dependent methyltransferase [Rhizobiales bacterium]|nr:class I SAM-dependent methyltransferase [Hyphomicrobiales bacterium]